MAEGTARARGRRRPAKTAPDAPATGETTATGKPRRQAIVVVHGQGEQRPMGTLRNFIEVLWTRNPNVSPADPEKYVDARGNRAFWVVPDRKAGLYELQRVTTPADTNGRRTDFFELYYADLLNDTPVKNLWRWLNRLLRVDPADLPPQVRWPWSIFLILAILATALFWIVVLSVGEIVHTPWLQLLVRPETRPWFWLILVSVAIGLAPKLLTLPRAVELVPKWLLGGVILLSLGVIYWGQPVVLYLDALIVEFYFAWRFLLPYFGDAASYLSAQTETVESRQRVRTRGHNLLRALHDDDSYERIVVVAHSLGTVLAYDLIHILWGEVGPTKDNPPDRNAIEALRAVDRFVAGMGEAEWSDDDIARYQDLQWSAFKALRTQRARPGGAPPHLNGWKISDFVALGSPLSSAQFLITDSEKDFALMKAQRVLPTAPAQAYDPMSQSLYFNAEVGQEVSHHGAAFSAVRWTNIYDPFNPVFFFLGDPIAGPVRGKDRFGEGVADIPVSIHHQGPVPRLFTHNFYWTETSTDWMKPSAHITTLRNAIDMSRS